MKHLNNNTSHDNTNDNTYDDDDDDDDDNAYDSKIRDKISDIRIILSRLGNILTNKDKKKIKKELYEIEKKQNLSDNEKEKIYDHLLKLVNILNKKKRI